MSEEAAPIRGIRVPDSVWAAAQEACREEGVDPDMVVTAALEAFVQAHRRGGSSFPAGKGTGAGGRRLPASSYDRNVQRAAARARVAINERLGVPTPEWIVALSKEERDWG
ncbi:hypothetical protein [Sinomonas sp. RB5]